MVEISSHGGHQGVLKKMLKIRFCVVSSGGMAQVSEQHSPCMWNTALIKNTALMQNSSLNIEKSGTKMWGKWRMKLCYVINFHKESN